MRAPKTVPRMLVAYAIAFGATYVAAQLIATLLRTSDVPIDVRMVINITDIQEYTAAVVGGPIFNGARLPKVTRFVQQFEQRLASRFVTFFAVSMTMRNDTPENRRIIPSARAGFGFRCDRISIGHFGGQLNYQNLSRMALWWLAVSSELNNG